ncbi:MAG TPA: DUF484 family protein [Nevskiaceae bacterium]|nr:DUF484 family protein [Nevskiaceae bacterium]
MAEQLKTAKIEKPEAAPYSEAEVADFLKARPDFFSRYPDLLESIELAHRAGSAVSLIEKQVDNQRARNQKLEEKLTRLLDAARDNEKRADHVHKLARTLLRAPSLAGAIAGLRQCMREDFGIDEIFVGINAKHYRRHDIEGLTPLEAEGRIALGFVDFFRTRLTECGPIAEQKSRLLFGKCEPLPQSAAIVPLERDKNLGMLAFGSRDPERFQPRQGKMFLEMTAELVAAAMRARL